METTNMTKWFISQFENIVFVNNIILIHDNVQKTKHAVAIAQYYLFVFLYYLAIFK